MKKSLKILKVLSVALLIGMMAGVTGCKEPDNIPDVIPENVPDFIIDEVEIPCTNMVGVTGGVICEKDTNILEVFAHGRKVKIPSFQIGAYEVTQQFYKAVMSDDENAESEPSLCKENSTVYVFSDEDESKKDLRPVENVTWYDAVYFCNRLSEKSGRIPYYVINDINWNNKHIVSAEVSISKVKGASKGYRLPFEVEWEYAARGADSTAVNWKYEYAGSDDLDTVGWYSENTVEGGITGTSDVDGGKKGYGTHVAGLKNPVSEKLKIFDMSGNVFEWCYDLMSIVNENTPFTGPESNTDNKRILRGGSWCRDSSFCYRSSRGNLPPATMYDETGFRICCSLK